MDRNNPSNERNPHAAWLRQFAEFIRDVISPSEKQHLQHCADLIDRDEVETSPPLTDSERAMIQTWPNLNNHVKALEKWIDQIEDICYDKVMHYREKVEQIGRIIDCEIPEPSETTAPHADTERLDFMEINGLDCLRLPTGDAMFSVWLHGIRHDGQTPREAIDKARATLKSNCEPASRGSISKNPQP